MRPPQNRGPFQIKCHCRVSCFVGTNKKLLLLEPIIGGRFNAIGHTPNKVGLKKVLCGRELNYNPVS
jgi:hypothetical protein